MELKQVEKQMLSKRVLTIFPLAFALSFGSLLIIGLALQGNIRDVYYNPLFAPFIEEGIKFSLALFILTSMEISLTFALKRKSVLLQEPNMRFYRALFFACIVAGVAFGVHEHFNSYPSEALWIAFSRPFLHACYTGIIAFGAMHFFKGSVKTRLLCGFLLGCILHMSTNAFYPIEKFIQLYRPAFSIDELQMFYIIALAIVAVLMIAVELVAIHRRDLLATKTSENEE